jgi:hypothetical protein
MTEIQNSNLDEIVKSLNSCLSGEPHRGPEQAPESRSF